MLTLINIIYSALCMAIPCMFSFVYLMRQRKQKRNLMFHFFEIAIFLVYIYMVFSVTGIGSVWEIGKYGAIIRLDEINLIPFQPEKMTTNVLNLIMFIPFGFLVPFIWSEYRNGGKVLITGALFSFSIDHEYKSLRKNHAYEQNIYGNFLFMKAHLFLKCLLILFYRKMQFLKFILIFKRTYSKDFKRLSKRFLIYH